MVLRISSWNEEQRKNTIIIFQREDTRSQMAEYLDAKKFKRLMTRAYEGYNGPISVKREN